MPYLVVTVLSLLFGALVQQLGSASIWLGVWTATAAQVSAPWLVLPFVVGSTQRSARRAAILGAVGTAAALFGYFAMTYSPLEIHPWTLQRFTSGLVAVTSTGYNPAYVVGGLLTAPVYGWLGWRWRTERSPVAAAAVVLAICLEPAARLATGQLYDPATVWLAEIAIGLALAGAFLATRRADRAT
jgi:hypothetical protein